MSRRAAEPEVHTKDSTDDLFSIEGDDGDGDSSGRESQETIRLLKNEGQDDNSHDSPIPGEGPREERGSTAERINRNGERLATIDRETSAAEGGFVEHQEENGEGDEDEDEFKEKEAPVTWMSLPHKRQLVILTLSRLSEPLVQTSLQSYMFYQLKSFDQSLSDSVISAQAGLLASSFTGAQFITAMLWGRLSDSEWCGRKMVLLIGLLGTLISVLGFGFSQTFWQAMIFRTAGGALNGNTGVMRTMVSEIVQEKKYQSRAFIIFPMCYNIGVIIGPILGGLLADPAGTYPSVFGGIAWLEKFPYAAPNILSAFFLITAASLVFFGLEETLQSIRHKEDLGTMCFRKIRQFFNICRGRRHRRHSLAADDDDVPFHAYAPVSAEDADLVSPSYSSESSTRGANSVEVANANIDVEMSPVATTHPQHQQQQKHPQLVPRTPPARYRHRLPFRRIFTSNVINTFIAHLLLATHIGSFQSLWFVFLSTPVDNPASENHKPRKLPFFFTGGLGMPPRDVGFAMAFLGTIGISMQLFVYPRVTTRLGVLKSLRLFLFCFPLAYILAPFLSIVPSRTPPPAEKDGFLIWFALGVVLFVQVTGRTFALPAMTILVNNCSPHPSVLGTVHGIGQSVSSAGRTIGPMIGGWVYGYGLKSGVVGLVWWGMSILALVGIGASFFVWEGDGHEVWLEGDREAEKELEGWVKARKREKVRLRKEAELLQRGG